MSLTDFPRPTVAHRLEYAAQIIKANGLYQDGGYWQGWGGKIIGSQWKPGMPCCVVAAFSIGRGWADAGGEGLSTPEYDALHQHLLRTGQGRQLDARNEEVSVTLWSDTADSAQVVIDTLLAAAKWEREHGDRCE